MVEKIPINSSIYISQIEVSHQKMGLNPCALNIQFLIAYFFIMNHHLYLLAVITVSKSI